MCCCNCCYSGPLLVTMLIVALAMSGVSFLGPWWVRVSGDNAYMSKEYSEEVFTYGLWGYCDETFPEGCHMWPAEVFTGEESLVAWYFTCIALFGFGFLLILLAVPIVTTAVCRPPAVALHNIGGFALICAGILKMVAIIGYGIFSFVHMEPWEFILEGVGAIYFGYYMGMLAAIIAFFSGISVVRRARRLGFKV